MDASILLAPFSPRDRAVLERACIKDACDLKAKACSAARDWPQIHRATVSYCAMHSGAAPRRAASAEKARAGRRAEEGKTTARRPARDVLRSAWICGACGA